MYRGFNLEISDPITGEDYLTTGRSIAGELQLAFENRLDHLLSFDDIIDGNEVIKKWFPEIVCDIFLSHSRKDQVKALSLAGFLAKHFGLKTFIDSSVWGYSDVLLKVLDDNYCKNEDGKTYNYNSRNYSTSHVHLMLKSALDKMIDNCEAVFFLNTPNSVSATNSIEEKTKSPWIFSEIATTQIIRKKTPFRLKRETKLYDSKNVMAMTESAKNQLQIQYELELNHFTKLDMYDLRLWKNQFVPSKENPLDLLYKIHPINSKFLI